MYYITQRTAIRTTTASFIQELCARLIVSADDDLVVDVGVPVMLAVTFLAPLSSDFTVIDAGSNKVVSVSVAIGGSPVILVGLDGVSVEDKGDDEGKDEDWDDDESVVDEEGIRYDVDDELQSTGWFPGYPSNS